MVVVAVPMDAACDQPGHGSRQKYEHQENDGPEEEQKDQEEHHGERQVDDHDPPSSEKRQQRMVPASHLERKSEKLSQQEGESRSARSAAGVESESVGASRLDVGGS